jgi:hypothetical protein
VVYLVTEISVAATRRRRSAVSSRGTIREAKRARAVSGVLSNRFVKDAKVFFEFAELVLEV